MARIVGGNPLGEFRGKLGGLVYSRNKAGQYARSYAKPVDPRTQAQITARQAFAQAVSGFHTLTPMLKSGWNSFASQYFTSKNRGNVPGIHSGVNAFVSLRNTLINMQRTIALETPVVLVNEVAAIGVTMQNIFLNSIAPQSVMEGVLAGGNYIIGSSSASFEVELNEISVELNLIPQGTPSNPNPGPTGNSVLTDGNGKSVGFAAYISNKLNQAGTFVNNPDIILLGNTGLFLDYVVTIPTVPNKIEITFPTQILQANYKNDFQSGQFKVGLFMYNSEGQVIQLSSTHITNPLIED
jgi:hypothetical protein